MPLRVANRGKGRRAPSTEVLKGVSLSLRRGETLATTTGPHNVFAIVVCRDVAALDTYLADRVGSLPGVNSIDTTTVNAYAKRAAPTPLTFRNSAS